ncbi:ribosomal maturation YjgA family protein [Bacillus sp. BC08]
MKTKRNRLLYVLFTIVVIILGLSSRKLAFALPQLLNDYLGDALWALMIFTGFGFLFPKIETKKLAFISLLFCYGIEVSQLYHAEWVDSIRAKTLGGLVLGYGFLWSDLVAYTIGVGVGFLFEFILRKK